MDGSAFFLRHALLQHSFLLRCKLSLLPPSPHFFSLGDGGGGMAMMDTSNKSPREANNGFE